MTEIESSVHRQLGSQDARLANVERRLSTIEDQQREILATLNRARGGVWLLMALASAAGALGTFVAKYLHVITQGLGRG